jgi:hypothetical protein
MQSCISDGAIPRRFTITSGKTYRLYVTAVVTNTSGSAETVDDYLEKVYN